MDHQLIRQQLPTLVSGHVPSNARGFKFVIFDGEPKVSTMGFHIDPKPFEGKVCAWLGGKGGAASDSLYQAIEITANAKNATLSFYVHIETTEKSSVPYDYLKIQVRDAKGNRLGTLATLSNADKNTGYDQKTLDLTAYKGKKVQLCFTTSEDRVSPTSFVLDKVSLAVK